MTSFEDQLAAELAAIAAGASHWGDPVGRIRTAARRQQQRQLAVVAAAGVMTTVTGVAVLPRVDAKRGAQPASGMGLVVATPTPSPTDPPPSPTPEPEPTEVEASEEPSAEPTATASPVPVRPSPATASPSPREASPMPSPTPSQPPAPYGPGMVVGREYRYDLSTHCGVEFAHFDGREWRTDSLDDGSGNPPEGWGNPYQSGTLVLIERDLAEFRSDTGETLRFEPTLQQPPMCM